MIAQVFVMIAGVAMLSLAPLVAQGAEEAPVVSSIPGERREFKVTGVSTSADAATLTVKFQSARGIFAFELHALDPKVTKLVLLMEAQRFCEGLTFHSKDEKQVELNRTEGTSIQRRGADLAIELTGTVLAKIRAGGKIQYINQYR